MIVDDRLIGIRIPFNCNPVIDLLAEDYPDYFSAYLSKSFSNNAALVKNPYIIFINPFYRTLKMFREWENDYQSSEWDDFLKFLKHKVSSDILYQPQTAWVHGDFKHLSVININHGKPLKGVYKFTKNFVGEVDYLKMGRRYKELLPNHIWLNENNINIFTKYPMLAQNAELIFELYKSDFEFESLLLHKNLFHYVQSS